jgi:hypothetical protein
MGTVTGYSVMYNLTNFDLRDMAECAAALRKMGSRADSLFGVADQTVRFMYDNFQQSDGTTSCALVRFFKTHRYDQLTSELQQFASQILGGRPASPNIFCLTLMATAGDEPNWNTIEESQHHRAIPLDCEEMLERTPMMLQLIHQFGVDASTVLWPNPEFLVDIEQTTFNVFHVASAKRSPFVPAQEQFVIPHRIKSVLGFGGMLPTGELFAVILFSKVEIPRQTAEMFRTLALSVKVAILPFTSRPLFT